MGAILAAIFSFILNSLYAVVRLILRILKDLLIATKLIFPVVTLTAGVILTAVGTIKKGEFSYTVFLAVLALSALFTVSLWVKALTRPKSRKEGGGKDDRFSRTKKRPIARKRLRRGFNNQSGNAYMANLPNQNPNGYSLNVQNQNPNGYGLNVQNPAMYGAPNQTGGTPHAYHSAPQGQAMPLPTAMPVQPKIYRVKQDPAYIMHEYPDRVELFKETPQGPVYVRTDYNKSNGI